jgi:hypothetical protein
MTDVQSDAPISLVEIATTGDNSVMSAREAAQALASFRHKRTEEPNSQEAPEPAADEPAIESGDELEAGTDENPPTGDETESATDTAAEPPIEPPRSWTKEAKERFASLPRDTQEYLAQREDERDRDFSRRQTETAEKLKGLTAKEQAVEQARSQYETALPALLETIQQQQNAEFGDIRTVEDVQRLAREDWPRYVMWDAKQKQLASVQQQVEVTKHRQAQEKQQKFGEFVKREAELFAEKVPEFADPVKKTALQDKAVAMLHDLGFADQELGELGRGERELSIYDHRIQLLINDGIKFRAGQSALKAPTRAPVPPVQRPGVSQPRGAAQTAVVQNLTTRLNQTGSAKDAARLLTARRAAR